MKTILRIPQPVHDWNIAVELFDRATEYRFDRCDPEALIAYARARWGDSFMSVASELERLARDVGYFGSQRVNVEFTVLENQSTEL